MHILFLTSRSGVDAFSVVFAGGAVACALLPLAVRARIALRTLAGEARLAVRVLNTGATKLARVGQTLVDIPLTAVTYMWE